MIKTWEAPDDWELWVRTHTRIQRGDVGSDPHEKHQNIGFLINTGPNPLKNHKATKPEFNNGPSSVRQRNAIMAFRWRADDDPFLVLFAFLYPLPKNDKKLLELDSPGKTLWIRILDPSHPTPT